MIIVFFDNVWVFYVNLVGEEGQGFIIVFFSFDLGCIGIGMFGFGIVCLVFEYVVVYVNECEQFGKKICEFEGVLFKIVWMVVCIESVWLVGLKVVWFKDQGQFFFKEVSIVKLFGSEVVVDVMRDVVQIFGGNGYSVEYLVEKFYCDVKIIEIYEGIFEIQQFVISWVVFVELEK